MSIKKNISLSPAQTKKIGRSLALEILRGGPKESAALLFLEGELGGGKTTFVQGFARGLGIKEAILSPTFVILKKFKITKPQNIKISKYQNIKISKYQNFCHIDCYRIKNEKEMIGLGFKKIVSCPGNIVCVEWPERIKKILVKPALRLKFRFLDKNQREITVSGLDKVFF